MKEWLDHYIKQGVTKFLLIDNGSSDNYLHIINPYIKANKVHLVVDSTKHKQVELYNIHYLDKCKKYEWVLVCDLDEFIYARKGFSSIKKYLESVAGNITQICIPWKIFGSCGYDTADKKQPESVIESFTTRINYDKDSNFQGVKKEDNDKYSLTKSIVRTKFIQKIHIHSHMTLKSVNICSDSISNIHREDTCFAKINETILNDAFLHLNHYAIQSYDWFMKVKASRGDVSGIYSECIRDENYFRTYDSCSNDLVDDELARLKVT